MVILHGFITVLCCFFAEFNRLYDIVSTIQRVREACIDLRVCGFKEIYIFVSADMFVGYIYVYEYG